MVAAVVTWEAPSDGCNLNKFVLKLRGLHRWLNGRDDVESKRGEPVTDDRCAQEWHDAEDTGHTDEGNERHPAGRPSGIEMSHR